MLAHRHLDFDMSEDTLARWMYHMEAALHDMRAEISAEAREALVKFFQHMGTMMVLAKTEHSRVTSLGPLDDEFGT